MSGPGNPTPSPEPSRALTALERVREAYPDGVRSQAVQDVDSKYGYTMEFAPSPAAHHEEYDDRTIELLAPFCADPECPFHGTKLNRVRPRICPLDT